MKKKGKGEPDMAFLVKRIVDCSSVITTVYDVDEKYLKPKILKAYQKCVENKEAEFKFLLKLIFRIDPQKIENDMDRLLAGAGALDKLKQKSVWHVPCSSGCNHQDKVKLMTIHPNSEQRKN